MNDLLAKIGIPTAIGTAISLVVVVVPMLFKIDERYAKQEALEAEVLKLERQNAELRAELAQNAGFQQAMVAFIQQGRLPAPAASVGAAPTPAPVAAAPAPTPVPAAGPIVGASPQPLETIKPTKPSVGTVTQERPSNWRELSEGLVRQQERLAKE